MPDHGYTLYRRGLCRCYTCAAAVHAYDQHRARAIAYGTWNPWTPAEPVRTHIHNLLNAGIGTRTIAAAAGMPRQNIQHILKGRAGGPAPTKVRPATAEAILAVTATIDTLPPHTRIDVTGTRRRTQALAALGWPISGIANHIGMGRQNLSAALRNDRVYVTTARRIRDAYNHLWKVDPAQHGIAPHVIKRTLRHAQAAGWAPPGAWDDEWIDLPNADLAAELERLAAAMDDDETGRCYYAYRSGDPSPLIAAGATEYHRRRKARKEAAA